MSKIAVVYWSGTGNTEAMANAVADGVNENGGNATLYTADSFNGDMVNDFDAIAFGCPQWVLKFLRMKNSNLCLMVVNHH